MCGEEKRFPLTQPLPFPAEAGKEVSQSRLERWVAVSQGSPTPSPHPAGEDRDVGTHSAEEERQGSYPWSESGLLGTGDLGDR